MKNTSKIKSNDKFIAIDVGCGDAFFLQRNGVNILVDGGKSKRCLPKLLKSRVGDVNLDIIVCTHCDADHINGLIGYYESGMKSKETWLPGSWSHRIDDLIQSPESFARELYYDINEYVEHNEITESISLQDIGNIMSHKKIDNEDYGKIKNHQKSPGEESLESERVSKSIISIRKLKRILSNPKREIYKSDIEKNIKRMFESAIHSAVNILQLSSLACNAGSKIRWFEYSNNSSSGGKEYLLPVNSKEILSYKRDVNAFMYLALTKANIESLVFYSPAVDSKSGVLFTADSNFVFNQGLDFIQPNSIITTPHHGSESNKNTYERLHDHIGDDNIFIRSDLNSKSRPGNSYLKLSQKKYCTICRGSDNKMYIEFTYSKLKEWQTDNKTCQCK
ncbi:hypothetical protein HX775_02870 [Serratia proteamaculans]|uniref:hypothetical protein n=1 Tax=Serratia proteamaculans TaxID=28151 RepID=UPI0015A1D053|nr:hypothetical protein [Serratia proteamaculans]NWA70860.1 hypothetical protein [Serratia proteamaculans]